VTVGEARDRVVHGGGVGNVERQRLGVQAFLAKEGHPRLDRLGVPAVQGDHGAVGGERIGHGETQAAGGAAHQGDPAVEGEELSHVGHSSLLG
jgi:hypothetical protein